MALSRRFTAKAVVLVLLFWLFLALAFHLRSETLTWVTGTTDKAPASAPYPTPTNDSPIEEAADEEPKKVNTHFSEDGNEPDLLPHHLEALNQTSTSNNSTSSSTSKPISERRTAVVVASRLGEDPSWLDEYFPAWEKNIYRVDDPNAKLKTPLNKGRESMVYLTYIIDNYASLPHYILFLHPQRYQWHNDDPDFDGVPMLRHFQLPYLEAERYVNIRCVWVLGCPAEIHPIKEAGEHREAIHAGGVYKESFERLFPGVKVPETVGVSCCAQFGVTREKILERPRSDYVRYRQWLLDTELDDGISGRILEYSWHMIFGKGPVNCPSAKDCYCNVFGLCNLECEEEGSCKDRYTLARFATLPQGWPYTGWEGEARNRSSPET